MRQGCCLSATIFNLYIEDILNNILEEKEELRVEAIKVHSIRFANYMIILASYTKTLTKHNKIKLEEDMKEYRMKTKVRKTKVMTLNAQIT